MDVLGISHLLECICVDTDATFLQENEVSQNKLHDFSSCPPGGCCPTELDWLLAPGKVLSANTQAPHLQGLRALFVAPVDGNVIR
jgi:hypothetical protein